MIMISRMLAPCVMTRQRIRVCDWLDDPPRIMFQSPRHRIVVTVANAPVTNNDEKSVSMTCPIGCFQKI